MTWLYRLALRLLPREVRERHGEEMIAVFEQQVRDRRRQGRRAAARAALAEVCALAPFAWREHRGFERRDGGRRAAWNVEMERTGSMRDAFFRDLRHAVRLLARTPGFTFVCVLTMALAIGANTAVFSVVHAVLLSALPYPGSDRLVVLGHRTDRGDALDSTTPGNFYDWQTRTTAFESMAAFAYTERVVAYGDSVERTRGVLSAGSIFDVLGVPAAEGRTFTAADDLPGAEPVVVLSAALAARAFGNAPAAGASLGINGTPFHVIGVMPPDFSFPDGDARFWVPARFGNAFRGNRDQFFLRGVARLRPEASLEQSRKQLNTVLDAIRRDYPQHTQNVSAAVVPLKEFLVGDVRTRLWTLLGAVVFVLLIACANIANLLLARGAGRRHEMAMRHLLGASSSRLVRQMLTESVVLAMLGALVGIGLGAALLRVLVTWLPDDLPRASGIGLDATVLGVTLGASVLAGLAFGLWPARQHSMGAVNAVAREGARGSARTPRLRAGLVVAEIALSLVLLVASGLLVRSFANLVDVRPGFDTGRLLTFTVSLGSPAYREPAARMAYFSGAAGQLRSLPGVTAVALSSTVPVAGRGVGAWFNRLDRPLPPDETPPAVPYRVVSANYFAALGIPLKRGRTLTEDDRLGGMRAVVVSESVERRFWPNESALGKRIYLGAPDNRLFPDAEIVGIVGDVKQTGLDEANSEAVYIPHGLRPEWSFFTFVVRTAGAPESAAAAVRAALRRIDPAVPVHNVRTMDDIVTRSLAPARSSMYLMSLFGALAAVLALVGVFGVLSYNVSQRRLEMAIRLALGASPRLVTGLVLGQGMRHVAAGIAVGLAGCVLLTRYLQELLFDVRPADPVTLATVSAALALAAAAAIYLAGRRAGRVDPLEAAREA